MLSRLETMTLMAADIPLTAVRGQIASAIDILVHLGRLRDRSRRVLEITEVTGYAEGEIQLNPLYRFEERGDADEDRSPGGAKQGVRGSLHSSRNACKAGKASCSRLQPVSSKLTMVPIIYHFRKYCWHWEKARQ